MGRGKGAKETGEASAYRKERAAYRKAYKKRLLEGTIDPDLPEPLVPDLFKEIQTTYWRCLKSVEDPRKSDQVVYPLHLILHRIISGFIGGTRQIGVLFPKNHTRRTDQAPDRVRKLGALPTRQSVYRLLRQIDWDKANASLAPLWERLGYTPDLVVKRQFRDSKEILREFRAQEKTRQMQEAQTRKLQSDKADQNQGMSAACAKRSPKKSKKPKEKLPASEKAKEHDAHKLEPIQISPKSETISTFERDDQHDLVLDGKVVRATYNSGHTNHFVHVSEIKTDDGGQKKRFILGAKATELDKNGEWGAALSILDALTPLPKNRPVLVSGDASFCVEEFARWLTAKGYFYLFRIKKNAGHIFERLFQWADHHWETNPDGDFFEQWRISGSQLHSRRLWRLPQLAWTTYPGITEAFVVEKKT